MTIKNGATRRIVEFVTANPGKLSREVAAAAGIATDSGLLSYVRKQGWVFVAGPQHRYRFFATAELARASSEKVLREIELHRLEVAQRAKILARAGTIRRRARAQPNRKRHVTGRAANMCAVYLPPDVTISPTVKVTIAPPPRDRFAPEPGFERAITSDWLARPTAEATA